MAGQPQDRSGEGTWLAVGAAGTGVGVALWAAGQLGSLVRTGRWPAVPPSSAPSLALGVVRHWAAPSLAWPRPARPMLPPPWALYLGTMSVLAIGGSVLVAVMVAMRRRFGGGAAAASQRRSPSRSAWARRGDLASLRVRGHAAGRLTLGHRPGRLGGRGALVAAEPRSSVIVLGPSQSGKTSGLAVPAILEWDGPVLATSVKTDLIRDTMGWRQRMGPVHVYDPTGSTALPSATWSPLAGCGDWRRARQMAAWLCGAARARSGAISDEDFWYAAAAKLLAPHLLAAAVGRRTISDVIRWLDTEDEEEVGALLDQAGVPEAANAAAASWARDGRTRSSVYATAEIVLEAFADPAIAQSAGTCDIGPELLVGGAPATLYLCAPSHEQERLRAVFSTLLHVVLAAAYDSVARTGTPLEPALLVVLDEAANIAPLRDLDAIASTAAGHGVQLVTVWQDLAQIQARYGDRAATVVNNHRAKIVLSGVSDPATLDYVSRLLGEADVGEFSVTTSASGERSTTRAWRERRLLTDAELRRLRPGDGIVINGHLRPARVRLRPWFADAELQRRARA